MEKKDYPILLTRHLEALKAEWKIASAEIIESCRAIYLEGSGLANEFARFLEAPGKFIRPSMFLFGYRLGGNEPDEKLIRLALAFELLHTYLLIHDDIMDASDLRRGVPSVHRLCEAYHKKEKFRGDSAYFGVSMAILFGDIISSKAIQLWSEAEVAGASLPKARATFDAMHVEVCLGQYLDLMSPAGSKVPSRDIVAQIMEEKTSKYTMTAPLTSGLLMIDAPSEWVRDFGTNLGIAYQVADDILGVYGDPRVTGKSADSDIREGKATFLVWSVLESATSDDKQTVIEFYTGNDRSDDAVLRVKNLFDKYDARAKAGAIASEYMSKALDVLTNAPISDIAKDELKIFSKFVVERNK
ncbi:MAG: polyprenyl synthetase family protein [Candidatus Paceibacterota bacterium]|jgi:geranylgeranyl diphosphate synthase type I